MLALLLLAAVSAGKVPIPQGAEFGGTFLYTNIAAQNRAYFNSTGGAVPTDASGWPLGDCQTVVFDARPFPEWQCASNPTACVDDPWVLGIPAQGTYFFSLQGKATVSTGNDPAASTFLNNQTFDPASYTTSGFFTLKPGAPALAELAFSSTQRSAAAPPGSGFTALRILRPGHTGDADRTWSPELLAMMQPLDHARFMGITGTNAQAGYYGDAGHHYLEFSDRCLPSDALWPNALRPGCWGMPWEDVVSVAQASGKGVWINAPVSGTLGVGEGGAANMSTYAGGLALLLKNGNAFTGGRGLPAGVPVYVEHSNEVWNFGFSQYVWNKLAAIDECNATTHPSGCLWNNDGVNNSETWAQRRHIGKAYELSRTFASAFGEAAVPGTVRPLYADWPIFPQRYNATLAWFNATYGAPSRFLYGMASTGYFGGSALKTPMTLAAVYEEYRNSTANQAAARAELAAIAAHWGLQLVAYEAGPGWSVGNMNNLGQYIVAQRFAEMRSVTSEDVAAWAAAGGGAYNHFAMAGLPSRFGQWGHVEHFFNQRCARQGARLPPCAFARPTWPSP